MVENNKWSRCKESDICLEDLKYVFCELGVHNCKCSDKTTKFHFIHKDDLDSMRFSK